jgi:hypothetical protein
VTTRKEVTLADVFEAVRRSREARGVKPARPSAKYLARANALAEAIDLAKQMREGALGPGADTDMTLFEQEMKRMALEPEPAFAKLASLKHAEQAFLTYWNEATGPHIEAFWRELAKRGLTFQRRDVGRAALSRGRITSRVDYDAVKDAISDERFTDAEKKKLDKMLGAYERTALRSRSNQKA